VNNHAHVLDGIDEGSLRYLAVFVNSTDLRPFLTGMAQPKLNQARMNIIPCPIPPLAEQHRIVARVDELMGLLDQLNTARTARDDLRRAARDATLAALRDAADTEAVETAWARIAGQMDTLFTDPKDVKPLRLGILALAMRGRLHESAPGHQAEWGSESLGTVATLITKGTTPTSVGFAFEARGVNFIKVESIRRGVVDHRLLDCFISDDTHRALARSILVPGDVLFSIAGTIGKTALVREEDVPANTNQALAIIRAPHDILDPSFLKIALDSFVAETVRDKARGGAMMNVSLGDLRALAIPLPSLDEQRAVVQVALAFLALCDTLEARLTAARDLQAQFAAAAVHHLDV